MNDSSARLRFVPPLALALVLAMAVPSVSEGRAQAGPGTGPAATGDEDPAALFARGRDLLESGDAGGAAEAFEAMLARGIDHPAVRSNLGAAYSRLGRFDDAVTQQQRALELSGGNPAVRLNLAIALSKAGRIPEAAVAWKASSGRAAPSSTGGAAGEGSSPRGAAARARPARKRRGRSTRVETVTPREITDPVVASLETGPCRLREAGGRVREPGGRTPRRRRSG